MGVGSLVWMRLRSWWDPLKCRVSFAAPFRNDNVTLLAARTKYSVASSQTGSLSKPVFWGSFSAVPFGSHGELSEDA